MCRVNDVTESTIEGALVENFVFKQLLENKFSERFYYSRPAFTVSNGYEFDFWVKSRLDEKRYGIEVKVVKILESQLRKC